MQGPTHLLQPHRPIQGQGEDWGKLPGRRGTGHGEQRKLIFAGLELDSKLENGVDTEVGYGTPNPWLLLTPPGQSSSGNLTDRTAQPPAQKAGTGRLHAFPSPPYESEMESHTFPDHCPPLNMQVPLTHLPLSSWGTDLRMVKEGSGGGR